MEGRLLILFSVAVYSYASYIQLPDSQLAGLTAGGVPYLQEQIANDNAALEASVEAFQPINDTCQALAAVAADDCQSCVENKCNKRGEDVCSTWYTDVYFFFADDVPYFFEETVPTAFVDLGDEIVDLGEDAWEGIVEFNNIIDDATGVNVGEVVVDIGEGFEDFGVFVYEDILVPTGDFIIDAGEWIIDAGNWVGDLFTGKKRQLRRRRRALNTSLYKRKEENSDRPKIPTSEPSCDNLKDEPEYYCLYYMDGKYCDDCVFDPDTECPGWTQGVADVQTALDNRAWLAAATDQSYAVTKLMYDPSKFNAQGMVPNCKVDVHLFGYKHSFTVVEPINLFDTVTSGELIAEYAVAAAKAMDYS